jgi:hypothetical protein
MGDEGLLGGTLSLTRFGEQVASAVAFGYDDFQIQAPDRAEPFGAAVCAR